MIATRLLGVALLGIVLGACTASSVTNPADAGVSPLPAPAASTRRPPALALDAAVAPALPGARAPDGGARTSPDASDLGAAGSNAVDAAPATVTISVRAVGKSMSVAWGRTVLGATPLTFQRPRNSGPVDLVLRARGYFPVHVRAYTHRDDVVSVRAVPLSLRKSLLGAKEELPDLDGGVADGGTAVPSGAGATRDGGAMPALRAPVTPTKAGARPPAPRAPAAGARPDPGKHAPPRPTAPPPAPGR